MAKCFLRYRSESHFQAFGAKVPSLATGYRSRTEPHIVIADVVEGLMRDLVRNDVEVIPSKQYQPLQRDTLQGVHQPLVSHPKSLDDVLSHIRAKQAWSLSRGAGVHIAIVDTGVCGTMREFPLNKRSPNGWAASGLGDPWTDSKGHGSMTACIAAATDRGGGRFNGVAPDATIIACKTSFDDTELYQIYDHLLQLVEKQTIGRLVVNNSYGFYQCTSPGVKPTDPFPNIVRLAVSKGIVAVFAAGNNHVLQCKHDPKRCDPNSIWAVNSLDDVIAVGTVNERNRMDEAPTAPGGYSHRDSSRGPGEFAKTRSKPECVAPTYGDVMWGCGYQGMEWWGTSGAAPQVAGLAALLLAQRSTLSPLDVRSIIQGTCVSLPLGRECAGAGLINCEAAVSRAATP